MTKVAVATTSGIAADASREIAALGGNAVDCALAASFLTMNTQPGVCALAGSAFVTIWKAGDEPVTIDGNVSVPGRGLDESELGRGTESVTLDYGGGITTLIGPGSVAVPGSLAAVERASQMFGDVPWKDLLAPTTAVTREGFPLPAACHYYLGYSGEPVFSHSDDGFFAVHDDGRNLKAAGSRVVVPHLADTIDTIAHEGARVFYEGDVGRAIVAHVRDGGGALTLEDLAQYEAVERRSLTTDIGDWTLASTPPPAVGGSVLAAMLQACADLPHEEWDADSLAQIIGVQRAALDYRKQRLDLAIDVGEEAANLLELARSRELLSRWASSSTVHTSAVDSNGLACAVTASSGYGSGEMPQGTGLWLNNCLGELELNRRGLDAGPPGVRLPSNMAPSVARRKGTVLAAGSPGADRITTAMHQFLINVLQLDMPLEEAVKHPRVHVDTSGEHERLMAEPGLDLPELDIPVRVTPDLNMYFGGIGATLVDREHGFQLASDPRREGGTMLFDGDSI